MKRLISAPGKVILFGEHAVVYGRPAIAAPLSQIRAYADVRSTDEPLTILAGELDRPPLRLPDAQPDSTDPLEMMTAIASRFFCASSVKGEIAIRSDIPIARGLGSGAAVSAVLARAIAALLKRELSPDDTNSLVYEVEKLHHGRPSGIDNTVVVFEEPVYFVKDRRLDFIRIARPLRLVLADTGISALTRETVAAVRDLYKKQPTRTQAAFDAIGAIAESAGPSIETGDWPSLGELMTENHRLLQALAVSSPPLDRLVAAALHAGAFGAKLSGGGRGGVIIALVDDNSRGAVQRALLAAGAKRVYATAIGEETA